MAVGGWPSSPQVGVKGFGEKQSSPMEEARNRQCCCSNSRGFIRAVLPAKLSQPHSIPLHLGRLGRLGLTHGRA